MRTFIATCASAVLLLGLPLAGAISGAWAAVALTCPEHAPEPDPDSAGNKQCGMAVYGLILGDIGMVLAGLAIGLAAGVAVALPAVNIISVWSADCLITDDDDFDYHRFSSS
jgi:hypothetical protein